MKKLIHWLSERKLVNGAILVAYFLLVVLPHLVVGKFIMGTMKHLSLPDLNSTVLLIVLPFFLFFLFLLFRNIIKGEEKKRKWFYLLATVGLIILVYNTLFVLATESAHFPQYALMAVLLFPLTWNYNATLFWATLLGAVDEAYQYFYLAPHATTYFDFNDVITDLLGAVLGLIFIWSFGIRGKEPSIPWFRRGPFLTGVSIFVIVGLLKILGVLTIYPSGGGHEAPILLVRKIPQSFWISVDYVSHVVFHVIEPLEGVILTMLLLLFYSGLGRSKRTF